jgi:protein PsiE
LERAVLLVIAAYAMGAVGSELHTLWTAQLFELKDMLQLFIYAEVLAMVAAFFGSHAIPIKIPLFIAITAICRLIILQNKDHDGMSLINESIAILLLAIAGCLVSAIRNNNTGD